MRLKEYIVSSDMSGQRIDNYLLRELKGVPRMLIYKMMRKGKIKLNTKRAKPFQKLVTDDVITMPEVRTGPTAVTDVKNVKLPNVAYEDDDVIIFDKPAGLAVHGGSGLSYGLIEAARHVLEQENLELAHRIDKETSGLVVIAKKRTALRELHELFRFNNVNKTYRAISYGQWVKKEHGLIELPLALVEATPGGKRSVVDEERGMKSMTRTTCVQQYPRGVELEIKLHTGKTHQARAHLAAVGLPIIGDDRYGDFKANADAKKAGVKGMMLHAAKLSFQLKSSEAKIEIASELPRRFGFVRKWLEGKTSRNL